jgi:predicted dehydrogenase
MTQTTKIKIAVIGVGVMGSMHAEEIYQLANTELAAICDIDKVRADRFAGKYQVPAYYDHHELLAKADLDAVLIATPHYDHPQIAIDAFERGIHVLTEKPIAVHVKAAEGMIVAHKKSQEKFPDLVFGVMFQQRTYGFWKKVKSLIDDGELGRLVRATWIITDWFRTQSYYDDGGWRATWKGEGGGVLLNQCPHNLDLYQWFVGMPVRVAGFASIGKYHNIEVEDEVTGYLEYENGMVGHILTSTAESPGTNRLEIIGENGHRLVTENFANAILQGEKLIAPAEEGINSLTLGNAIMLSSFLGHPIDLPLDAEAYAAKLQELIENSRFQKTVREREITDFSSSF